MFSYTDTKFSVIIHFTFLGKMGLANAARGIILLLYDYGT